jgi:hypothetical protein
MIGTMTMFYVVCDICGARVDGEFVAWTDEDSAKLEAEESEWTMKNGKHYCPSHWICQAPQCHVELGPLAGEQDYLCERHREAVSA